MLCQLQVVAVGGCSGYNGSDARGRGEMELAGIKKVPQMLKSRL